MKFLPLKHWTLCVSSSGSVVQYLYQTDSKVIKRKLTLYENHLLSWSWCCRFMRYSLWNASHTHTHTHTHSVCLHVSAAPASSHQMISIQFQLILSIYNMSSSSSSSSSSSCSWRVRHVILFLDPLDEVGPSISSSVVLCFVVLLVYIVVLVLVLVDCLCPSSVHVAATFPGTVLFIICIL